MCDENKETLALLTPPPITHAASTPSSQLSQLQKLYKYTHALSHIRTHPHTPVFLAHTFSRSPRLPPVGACVPTLCHSSCVCACVCVGLPYRACLWPCGVRQNVDTDSCFAPASSELSEITASQSAQHLRAGRGWKSHWEKSGSPRLLLLRSRSLPAAPPASGCVSALNTKRFLFDTMCGVINRHGDGTHQQVMRAGSTRGLVRICVGGSHMTLLLLPNAPTTLLTDVFVICKSVIFF